MMVNHSESFKVLCSAVEQLLCTLRINLTKRAVEAKHEQTGRVELVQSRVWARLSSVVCLLLLVLVLCSLLLRPLSL